MDRVHRLSAVLAAVADRGGHGQLRHRGRVPGRRAGRVREDDVSSRSPDSIRRRPAEYYEVQALVDQLVVRRQRGRAAVSEQARSTRPQAAAWLERYALMPHDRAAQRVRFFDQYRSYVINYNLGKDMVRRYIESRGGTPDKPAKRWEEFERCSSSPRLPSGLE